MATIPIRPAFLETGVNRWGGATIRHYTEASGQTFKRGDFVYLLSGNLRTALADPTVVLGMAMRDASGVAGTLIPVAVFDENTRVVLNYYNTDATPAAHPTSIMDIGTRKALVRLSPGVWVVDRDDTGGTEYANEILIVEGFYGADDIGDIGGRYVCKVIPSALQTCIDLT